MFGKNKNVDLEQAASSVGKKVRGVGIKGVLVAGAIIIGLNSFITVSVGESVRVQNNITGGHTWYTSQGMKPVLPFFTNVERFSDVVTIAVTDDKEVSDTAGSVQSPMYVKFADGYGGKIEASFRVKMPVAPADLEKIYQDVKTPRNLYGNTLRTFASDMINLTTDQFLAQDFMQGGKGAFKQRLYDQGQNGMLVTKREKVEVEGQVADQTLGGDRSQNEVAKQMVTKVIVQLDENGKPLRRDHSLKKYNIEVVQADFISFEPDNDLNGYMETIKERERARAKVVADQSLERDLAVTEQLKGERERITAKNKRLMEKDAAVIAEQQKTAVESERANLAKVQKDKELAIAKANENIQKANYAASKYQAQAELEVGLAQAKIKKADYEAIDKEVLRLEVQKATMLANAEAYKAKGIQMPLIVGGSNGDTNPLEMMSSMKVLEQLGSPIQQRIQK